MKFREHVAKTQQDRIQLEILIELSKISNLLEKIVADNKKEEVQIEIKKEDIKIEKPKEVKVKETKPAKKQKRKTGGGK